MSTAVVPPPSSASLLRHVPRLTARARAMLTAMNLHFAGVAALGVLVLYLIAHLVFVAQALSSHNDAALDQQRVTLRAAEIAAQPLRGLDSKLVKSTQQANQFYTDRLPYAYSQVLAELGALTKKSNVRLSGVNYAQLPALSGTYGLTEVDMDARISGDYRSVVEFINSVERDKMFFLISRINLTGSQTGQVNLRMRLATYLRPATEDELLNETSTVADGAAAVTPTATAAVTTVYPAQRAAPAPHPAVVPRPAVAPRPFVGPRPVVRGGAH